MKKLSLLLIILLSSFSLLTGSCSNNNPAPRQKIKIDLGKMQNQVGIAFRASGGIETPVDSLASDTIRTLVIGPLTYNRHGKVYSIKEPITEEVKTDIGDDIVNSGPYIRFIPVPSAEEYAEFDVPPITSGWQIIAIASNKVLTMPGDLQDKSNKDSLVYFGITEDSFTDVEVLKASDYTIKMRRACLSNPTPKGCAIYDKNKTPKISAAVEIIGVKVNNTDDALPYFVSAAVSFPIIVRDNPQGSQVSPATAVEKLNQLRQEMVAAGTVISKLTVYTTHRENPTESSACRQLLDSSDVASYLSSCEVQDYFFIY